MRYIKLFEKFGVSDKIKTIINNIVTSGNRKGVSFFDALDDAIKDEEIVLELVKNHEDDWIASSGGFGDVLFRLQEEGKFSCRGLVIFNGKMLTNNLGVNSWYPKEFDLNNKKFIYLDDSYFSGGTVKKISDFLKTKNSVITEVSVVYDGSEEKLDNVNSFYRYWDYRDLVEYKKRKKSE